MINEARQQLTDNKVFLKNVREELRAYNFTGISEETEEYLNLQNIVKCLVTIKNRCIKILFNVLLYCSYKVNQLFCRNLKECCNLAFYLTC